MLYFLLIAIAFSKDEKLNVNLTIGLDFEDNTYLNFYSNFTTHYYEFQQKGLNLNIAQHLLPCYSCFKRHQFKESEKNCLGGGRYCWYQKDVSGQIILKEFLQQQCVLEVLPEHYFNYSIFFEEECKKSRYSACSNKYFTNKNISIEEVQKCVENSFDQSKEDNEDVKTNRILEQYKKMQYNKTTFSLYLDSIEVTNTSYQEFHQLLCQKFINVSISSCQSSKIENVNNSNSLEQFFLFLFALIILILVASGGWTLLNKFQFGSNLVPKSRVTIPKLEGDHIIQEDDI